MRDELTSRYDFSVADSFQLIQMLGPEHKIDHHVLQRFIARNGEYLYEDDILNILRKFDLDQDARLSYEEFANAILPQNSQKKGKLSHRSHEKPKEHQRSVPNFHEENFSFASPSKTEYKALRHQFSTNQRAIQTTVTKPSSSIQQFTPVKFDLKDQLYQEEIVRAQYSSPLKSSKKNSISKEQLKESTQQPNHLFFSFNQKNQMPPTLQEKSKQNFLKKDSPLKHPEMPKNQLEHYEEGELARVFKELISLDKELENAKQLLSLKTDFNIEDCYKIFDIDEKGYFNRRELEEVFSMFEIYPSIDDISLIMLKYDKDSDEKLNFKEFCSMILPKDKNYSSLLLSRKSYNANFTFNRTEPFTPDTMREFISYLQKLVQHEGRAEILRHQLKSRPDFDFAEGFKSVDAKERGAFYREDLASFLEKSHYYATNKELQYIISRFDLDQDGGVSFAEFVLELQPKLFSR